MCDLGMRKLHIYDDGSGTAMCDFTILWGDERAGNEFSKGVWVKNCSIKSKIAHMCVAVGTYHVKIKGVYNGWDTGSYKKDRCNCEDYCRGHMLKHFVEMPVSAYPKHSSPLPVRAFFPKDIAE